MDNRTVRIAQDSPAALPSRRKRRDRGYRRLRACSVRRRALNGGGALRDVRTSASFFHHHGYRAVRIGTLTIQQTLEVVRYREVAPMETQVKETRDVFRREVVTSHPRDAQTNARSSVR